MADWADLTSTVRRTKGECPPPLVGASVTLAGDSIFVFGGRPVDSREMTNSVYALDLRSLAWAKLWPPAAVPASATAAVAAEGPAPRYFHSAQAWDDQLVIFGGQSYVAGSSGSGGAHLETLNELVLFDTKRHTWSFPSPTCLPGTSAPSPRYAHLSQLTRVASRPPPGFSQDPPTYSSRLVILGGQDADNNYLPDLAVLDLDQMQWVAQAPYPRKAGTYRSVAAAASVGVAPREEKIGTDGEVLVYSSHAIEPTEDKEEPVWVYSNSNFVSPRRDLDMIPHVHDALTTPAYLSLSDSMVGDPSFPPGLRFPHAYACGHHLVLSGAHVGVNRAEFVIWTLDLGTAPAASKTRDKLVWKALPLDKVFGKGGWGPAVGWRNTLVVVGDQSRDMASDYNSRQTNFSQIAFVDLEGFGVYVPPPQPIPAIQQQLGLLTMSQPQLFDYEIIASDKERLGCSRKLLEARWPWFADELRAVEAKAYAAVEAREQRTTTGSGSYGDSSDDEPIDGAMQRVVSPVPAKKAAPVMSNPVRAPSRIFPITTHSLELPLSAAEVKALLQYFHTLSLSTPHQRALPVLTSLLVFTKSYDTVVPALRALVIHALHETLETSPEVGAKVYEAAALGDSVALQIRAMQCMLSARRGSATSSHLEAPTSAQPSSSRFSGNSHASTSSSAFSVYSSGDGDSSLPYTRSSVASSQASTAASSVYNGIPSSGHCAAYPASSPLPPVPSGLPASLSSPPAMLSRQGPLPTPPSELPPGSYPSRNGSLSAATGVSAYSSPSSTGPPPSPSGPLPPIPSASAASSGNRSATRTPTASMAISPSTPAHIAEAWRAGEEWDRQQRAEAARLAAETESLSRNASLLRLGGERKGSVASSGAGALGSIPESSDSGFTASPTPSISNLANTLSTDNGSIRSHDDNSSMRSRGSNETKNSSERAAEAAASTAQAAAKVVKKGLFSGLLAGPTMHNAGMTKKVAPPTGPAPKRSYPRPTPRTAKGAAALAKIDAEFDVASSGGSSAASFRS
ncbi:uncharacterized protein JCM10292_005699 [Rhodotorula paludigena]|uniref:uncharacterized protein n=1 Tax=Rhodotorula paludigena TaxID=86838 RepID=UPI00317676D1